MRRFTDWNGEKVKYHSLIYESYEKNFYGAKYKLVIVYLASIYSCTWHDLIVVKVLQGVRYIMYIQISYDIRSSFLLIVVNAFYYYIDNSPSFAGGASVAIATNSRRNMSREVIFA